MYRKNGFTIVELAIVLVVVGIILAMAIKGKQLVDAARDRAELGKIMKLEAATAIYNSYVHGNFMDMLKGQTSTGGIVAVGVAPLRIEDMERLNIITFEQLKSRYKLIIASGEYSGTYDTYWMGIYCTKRPASNNTHRWMPTGPAYTEDRGSRNICSTLIIEEPVPGIDYSETPVSRRMVCLIEDFLDDRNMDTGSGLKTGMTAQMQPEEMKDCSVHPDDLAAGAGHGYKLF